MFFVEADAENPVAAGCIFSAISMLYLESADAAIPADVLLLTLIEMGLFAAAVGGGGIMELMEQLCERVEDVLTI